MIKIIFGARLSTDTAGDSMYFFSENVLEFHVMVLLLLASVSRLLKIDESTNYCCVSSSSK